MSNNKRKAQEAAAEAKKAEIRAAAKAIANGTETPKPTTEATKATTPKATKAEPVRLSCLCGCGGLAAPKRLFVQGHDARLKGNLQRLHIDQPSETDQDVHTINRVFLAAEIKATEQTAMGLAVALNPEWRRFLDAVGQKEQDRINRKAARDQEAKAQAAARAEKTKAKQAQREAERKAKAEAKQGEVVAA